MQGALVAGQLARGHLGTPAGAAHRWTVELGAGEYAEVEVGQRGVDLAVRVISPADSLRATFDGSWALQGTETARWVAAAPGRWSVEPAPYPPNATGDHEVRQLFELYGLRLGGVELAVLSACETNAGTAVEGEGVFALARGFHAAGARRVVASDWVVEDRSTAALVRGLFAGVAAGERGGGAVDYAAALRDAKRAVRAQPRWAHPYYWAPFVLTGAR